MKKSIKILFVYTHWQTFVREDFDILKRIYPIQKLNFKLKKSIFGFFLYQFLGVMQLLYKVPSNHVLYIWFCDYHAFWAVLIAKIFGKKSVIVVGGFDAVSVPSIDYGLFVKNNFRTRLAKWAYKHCDKILAVDQSLIKGENTFAGPDTITGVAHFVPEAEAKAEVVPTGYDAEKWKNNGKRKENLVLTVGNIITPKAFEIKGIRLFVDVAKNMPQYEFMIIGLQIPELIHKIPSNLTIISVVSQSELVEYYQKAKVYAQFSLSEGLPNVVCEAMLCECIPVVSAVNGMKTLVQKVGYSFDSNEIEVVCNQIENAMQTTENEQVKSRMFIKNHYSRENRVHKLEQIISAL